MLADLLPLLRRLWPITVLSTLMGAASGAATAALLAIANHALHEGPGARPALLWAFAGLCALALTGEVISDIGNNIVGQRVIAALRRSVCAKILVAPVSAIEQMRSQRLITLLNQDIDTISGFSFMFSSLAIATTTIVGCLVYLLVLSPAMLAITLVALALGSVVQSLARRVGIRRFGEAREAEDRLQQNYRAMTDGAKELRINGARRRLLYREQLSATIDAIYRLRVRAANVFVSANAFGSLLFFMVVGLVLVWQLASSGADRQVVTGFVLVLLYMKGPIQEIVGALPSIGRAQVAWKRVVQMSTRFQTGEPALLEEPSRAVADAVPAFESLALRDVQFQFPSAQDEGPEQAHMQRGFALGPVSLTVRRGETVFIVGENGCGKTTLVKLLLALYEPQQGELLMNGVPVHDDQREAYRQLFSAVFSDYYLFDTLLASDEQAETSAKHYLERLEIAHKVSVINGAFSTTDLSTGQRKRLALVHAYLEQRPVIVLDEWAADQDPTFRRIFYTEILPDLKRQGKTLIVISHDDRYFSAADRCLRMEDGHIVEEFRVVKSDMVERTLTRNATTTPSI